MLAKIQAGATGYDLVWPSVHMHDIMQQLGLLEKTNVNQLNGFENIDPSALKSRQDPNADYCLPYAWGPVGIFYNKKVVGGRSEEHTSELQSLMRLSHAVFCLKKPTQYNPHT